MKNGIAFIFFSHGIFESFCMFNGHRADTDSHSYVYNEIAPISIFIIAISKFHHAHHRLICILTVLQGINR